MKTVKKSKNLACWNNWKITWLGNVRVCVCVCGEVAPNETEEMTKKNRQYFLRTYTVLGPVLSALPVIIP